MPVRLAIVWLLMLASGGCGFCAAAPDSSTPSFRPEDVRVELSIRGSEFRIGQPIPYEIKVTNLGFPVSYLYCSQWRILPGYSVEIVDQSGKTLPVPAELRVVSSVCGSVNLDPGKSASFRGYLNQWAVLDKPGNYKVKVLWSPFEHSKSPKAASAPISLSIEKATDAERDRILTDARRQLKDASTLDEMQDAIWTLAYTLDARAVPDLVQAGRDINVSQEAESALVRFSNRTDIQDEFLKELREHGPTESLAYALSHFKVPVQRSLPLLRLWLGKGDAAQRAAALLAISMIRESCADKALREQIIAQLADKDPRVRHYAVLALGDGQFADTLRYVMTLASDDPDMWVREQAIIAVGWYKDDRAIPLLKRLAKDQNAAVRRAAIDALKNIGSSAAKAALAECCADPARKSE